MTEAVLPSPEPGQQATGTDKRLLAQRTLEEILVLMEVPATLDVKDGPEGSISIALHLQGELPGVQAGKRSHVLEALQFLINKVVNRPGTERRWVALGAGGHPEPRPARPVRAPAPAGAAVGAPAAEAPAAPAPGGAPSRPAHAPAPAPAAVARAPSSQKGKPAAGPLRPSEPDERTLQAPEDPPLRAEARKLAEKSAQFGRFMALVGMKPEERAQVLSAVTGVPGLSVQMEGEGRGRRVVFTPEKPTPMPTRALPDDDEELE